jgi:hypothetical protein
MCLEFHITLAVVVTVNPSTYVELPIFCISELLSGFNFVVSLSVLVSFGEVKETVTQKWCKHSSIKYCVGKENKVLPVLHVSQHEPSALYTHLYFEFFTLFFHSGVET